MSENITPQEEVATETEAKNDEQIVEVPWEEVRQLFEIREALKDIDSRFSDLLLSYEKQKAAFLARSQELETFLYEQGSELRDKLQVNAEATYELKLPAKQGEKGYFIRKD